MKRQLNVFVASIVGLFGMGAVHAAATLTTLEGAVRVNQGKEFVAATLDLALNADDRIMTLDDGHAIVTFDDGCKLEAGPNTLITVPATSTCAGGIARTQNIAPGSTEVVGAGGSSSWRTALLIAVPVIAAAAIIERNNDDEPTVSP
jgi:hypothetical protein